MGDLRLTQRASRPRTAWAVPILALALGGLPGFAAAQTQYGDILKRVDDHYNHLQSLRTRYTEDYEGMGMQRSESGTLLMKKPGRMRWTYDSPAGKLFVLDGKYAWSYTPGDAQAQRLPAKQMDDLRTPLRFLLGHTELKKELENIAITQVPTGFRIVGVPKGMQNRVKDFTLDVTPSGEITAMKVEELDGAVTAFHFTDEQENVATSDAAFTFTPPPGVGIVNATPPI
jgi:outer membrane lipoprotein carrier protein